MDLTLAELQDMASRQQQQIEAQQQMLATKVESSQTSSLTAVDVFVEPVHTALLIAVVASRSHRN